MDEKDFIRDCLDQYKVSLFENDVSEKLIMLKKSLLDAKAKNKKVIIAGNGGSSAISSHVSVDFTKQGGIRTVNFNEYDLITCFSNDYGYEEWVKRAVEFYGDEGDVFIGISSSGSSENILRANIFFANHSMSEASSASSIPSKTRSPRSIWPMILSSTFTSAKLTL